MCARMRNYFGLPSIFSALALKGLCPRKPSGSKQIVTVHLSVTLVRMYVCE